MEYKMSKVIIGLSGGLDSSISAYLLQKDGYEVEGIYMKLHNLIPNYHEKNLFNIQQIASFLGIKYHIIDLEDKFKTQIYDYFVQGYINGITPNPCVKCNREIKFGLLYDKAKELGGDYLATGHYAKTDGKFIYCADDLFKDQSYFIAQIKKERIKDLIFPMSIYKKETIKQIANQIKAFKTLTIQKESQEICFVETDYLDILKKHINIDMPGVTLDKNGNKVGHHKGYMHYTIGKRKGFYVHGAHERHFVLKTDKTTNTIVVGKREDLAITSIILNELNMFIEDETFECEIKLRYRTKGVKCKVNIDQNQANILLYEPVYGVACGQYGVMYQDCKVVGSGIIISAKK
jgi:tRNA-specific 2-thiouridylase